MLCPTPYTSTLLLKKNKGLTPRDTFSKQSSGEKQQRDSNIKDKNWVRNDAVKYQENNWGNDFKIQAGWNWFNDIGFKKGGNSFSRACTVI